MKKFIISSLLIVLAILPQAFTNAQYRTRTDKQTNFNPYRHRAGISAGYTVASDKLSGFNLALNYEIKKKRSDLGFGVFFNGIFAENLEFALGLPVYKHNIFGLNNLSFLLGPGLANTKSVSYLVQGDNPSQPNDYFLSTPESRINFLLRAGVEYEFKLPNETENKFSIYPFLHIDFISFEREYYTFGIKTSINF